MPLSERHRLSRPDGGVISGPGAGSLRGERGACSPSHLGGVALQEPDLLEQLQVVTPEVVDLRILEAHVVLHHIPFLLQLLNPQSGVE